MASTLEKPRIPSSIATLATELVPPAATTPDNVTATPLVTPPMVEAADGTPSTIAESATTFMSKLDALRPSTWAIKGMVAFQNRRKAETDPASLTHRLREHKVGRLLFDAAAILATGRIAVSAVKGILIAKGYAVPSGNAHLSDSLHMVPMSMVEEDQKLLTDPSPSASASASPSPSHSPSVSPSVSHAPSPEASATNSRSASPTPTPTASKASPSPSVSTSASPSVSYNQANTPTGYGTAEGGNQTEPRITTVHKQAQPAVTEGLGSKPSVTEVAFSKDAQTISRGEGWYHQFNDMGIDEKHHQKLLKEIGPELKKRGLAYYDKSHGEWRMNFTNVVTDEHGRKHGVIKDKDLRFIYEVAVANDYASAKRVLPDLDTHIAVKPGDNLAEVADRSLNSYGIDTDDVQLREAFVTNTMGDDTFMKLLNDAHVLKIGGDGKPVLENGVPVIDTTKLEAAKNGTYVLPDAVRHELQTRIQEILKDVQADTDDTSEKTQEERRELARAGAAAHATSTAKPTASATPSSAPSPTITPTTKNEATLESNDPTFVPLAVIATASVAGVVVGGGLAIHRSRKRRSTTRPRASAPPTAPAK